MTDKFSKHLPESEITDETKKIYAEHEKIYAHFGNLLALCMNSIPKGIPGYPAQQINDRLCEAGMWFRVGMDYIKSRDCKTQVIPKEKVV